MDDFTTRAIAVIKRIPSGKVTTYGMVAAAAGNHCGARQVARILYSSSEKHGLPWHRVVNATLRVSLRADPAGQCRQRQRLVAEGVEFVGERIPRSFRWEAGL